MAGNTYALIRVSTEEQNEIRQVIRMSNLGIFKDNIVVEKESGKSPIRTKYRNLVKKLKSGDTLYLENIDRLGRDYDAILKEWNILTKEKRVTVKVLDTPMLDTDQAGEDLSVRFMRDVFLLIQAFQAEYEWQKIKARQAQGIAVAKANGKKMGRPKSNPSEQEFNVVRQYRQKQITLNEALQKLRIKKSAFYRLFNEICKY